MGSWATGRSSEFSPLRAHRESISGQFCTLSLRLIGLVPFVSGQLFCQYLACALIVIPFVCAAIHPRWVLWSVLGPFSLSDGENAEDQRICGLNRLGCVNEGLSDLQRSPETTWDSK